MMVTYVTYDMFVTEQVDDNFDKHYHGLVTNTNKLFIYSVRFLVMIIIGINDYAANTIENQAARDSHSQTTN